MNINLISMLAMIFALSALISSVFSIISSLIERKRYYRIKKSSLSAAFPCHASNSFLEDDLAITKQFSTKFRGSVRFGNLNIYTDSDIENMRNQSRTMLP